MNWPGAVGANVGAFLEDANINWDLTKGKKQFMVRVGQNKVPFGLQELISSGSQQFVDRALSSNIYFRGRDTGANVWGVLGNNKFEYRLGVYNGNGLTRPANDNDKLQKNARFTFQPNGASPMGFWGSGAHMTESDMDTRALGRPIFTVSAAFEENDLGFADPNMALTSRARSSPSTVSTSGRASPPRAPIPGASATLRIRPSPPSIPRAGSCRQATS